MRLTNSWVCGKPRMYLATLGMAPGEWPELGHEVRIGQKADIEDQVGVLGHSLLEAEADDGDQQRLGLARAVLKLLDRGGRAARGH